MTRLQCLLNLIHSTPASLATIKAQQTIVLSAQPSPAHTTILLPIDSQPSVLHLTPVHPMDLDQESRGWKQRTNKEISTLVQEE